MRIRVENYDRAAESGKTIFETVGVEFYSAAQFLRAVERELAAASALWPELKQYRLARRVHKKGDSK